MSHEAVAAVTALIELGMIAQDDIVKCLKKALSEPEPQRTWVGLSEEEVEACFHHVDEAGIGLFDFAEAIEAKLKEKNNG